MPQIALDWLTTTGEKGAKKIRASLFFPNTNGYDLTGIRSCLVILICNAFHFRAKEIIGYKRETI